MNQIEKESPVRSDASINTARRCVRRHVRAALLALIASSALLASAGASSALASFSIASFKSDVLNQDGTPATLAGSHPYQAVTSLAFSTDSNGLPTENVKDVEVNLPPGLIGDPNATPKCTVQQLDQNQCSGASQVGQLSLTVQLFSPPATELTVPLYNIVPPAGTPAQFGANILVANSFLDASVRTGSDYGLTTSSFNISADLPIISIATRLWGVPADPSHDPFRNAQCNGDPTNPANCFGGGASAGVPLKPFLTMPTTCASSMTTTARADSWQSAGTFSSMSYQAQDSSGNPVGITGCGRLSFSPSISAQPDTTVADSPTGFNVDLSVPQSPDDPNALATPTLQNAVVTLPKGLVLSASSADGLGACSMSQFGLTNAAEPTCPNASKIGSAEINSPIQADPLMGSIYLAQPLANEFHSPLAIYVAAESDGVLVKLAGNVQINPATGQMTTVFSNNPPLPFTDFKLSFFGGPRAAFATPESCGTFQVSSSLTPSSGQAPATPSDSFKITTGCVSGFNPSFIAGVTNPQAGAYSPFVVSFSRGDTDQELSGLTMSMPPGELAKLGSVPLCPGSKAATGSCPAGSQVGTALTGAGPGPHPLFLPGKVYLTGPYKGAPYGLADVVPVHAGPLNFGNVIVRQRLLIDKHNAHVTVISDPLPTSLLPGIFPIPLRLRRVDVTLNRKQFTVNPTNCTTMQVRGTLTSVNGKVANRSSRFQVGGCGSLVFSPALSMRTTGKVNKAGTHPSLITIVSQKGHQANLKSVQVKLPTGLAVDVTNIGPAHQCKLAAAKNDQCPANTSVGRAVAVTPLLKTPLSGKVYLVQNPGGVFPTLLVPLRGALPLDLTGHTAFSGNRLVTTFGPIPDAPISKFTLTINGGSHGILTTNTNLCKSKQTAIATMTGQNGMVKTITRALGKSCP